MAGSVEIQRRPRNLKMGPTPPPPTLEKMERSGREGVAAGNSTINHAMETMEERRYRSVGR